MSNVFWEQLSSTMPNLPTLHLINSYKEKLDAMSTVFNTPGKSPGAQVFFVQELQLAIAEFAVDRGLTVKDFCSQPTIVKTEGDSCLVSKETSWTTLSFLVIDSQKNFKATNYIGFWQSLKLQKTISR